MKQNVEEYAQLHELQRVFSDVAFIVAHFDQAAADPPGGRSTTSQFIASASSTPSSSTAKHRSRSKRPPYGTEASSPEQRTSAVYRSCLRTPPSALYAVSESASSCKSCLLCRPALCHSREAAMRAELCRTLVRYLHERLTGNGVTRLGGGLSWARDVLCSRYLGTAVTLRVVSMWRDVTAVLYTLYYGCPCAHRGSGPLVCNSECCPQHCSFLRNISGRPVHSNSNSIDDTTSASMCKCFGFFFEQLLQLCVPSASFATTEKTSWGRLHVIEWAAMFMRAVCNEFCPVAWDRALLVMRATSAALCCSECCPVMGTSCLRLTSETVVVRSLLLFTTRLYTCAGVVVRGSCDAAVLGDMRALSPDHMTPPEWVSMELQKSYTRRSRRGGDDVKATAGATCQYHHHSHVHDEKDYPTGTACNCGAASPCYRASTRHAHRVLIDACVAMVLCDVMWLWCNAPYMTMWTAYLTRSHLPSM